MNGGTVNQRKSKTTLELKSTVTNVKNAIDELCRLRKIEERLSLITLIQKLLQMKIREKNKTEKKTVFKNCGPTQNIMYSQQKCQKEMKGDKNYV